MIREISFDSVAVSFNESSITSIEELITELSRLAELIMASRQHANTFSDEESTFFAEQVQAKTITVSFLSEIGTWNIVLQDLLLALRDDKQLEINTTMFVSLFKNGREIVYGENALQLVGSSDLQRFHMDLALRELGIAGIQLRSQFLTLDRVGHIYQVTQADPDNQELQLNGELNMAEESWQCVVAANALSAGGILFDAKDSKMPDLARLGDVSIVGSLFQSLGQNLMIDAQLDIMGTFDSVSYDGSVKISSAKTGSAFSEVYVSGRDMVFDIERFYVQQADNKHALFAGSIDLPNDRINGVFDLKNFSLLSGRYLLDGRIGMRRSGGQYHVFSKNLLINEFTLPSLNLYADSKNVLLPQEAQISFSGNQRVAIQSASGDKAMAYTIALENVHGNTIIEGLQKLLPTTYLEFLDSVQSLGIVEDSIISVEGSIDLSEGLSTVPQFDLGLQWVLPDDVKVSVKIRHSENTFQVYSLGVDIFDLAIRGSSTIEVSPQKQSVRGVFRLGQKSYNLEGIFRNKYMTLKLSDRETDSHVVDFEYSTQRLSSVAMSLQAQNFLVPISLTQIPTINCNIQYYRNDANWELSILNFVFEDDTNDLKIKFSGYLDDESGVLNELEVDDTFSTLRGSLEYSQDSGLYGILSGGTEKITLRQEKIGLGEPIRIRVENTHGRRLHAALPVLVSGTIEHTLFGNSNSPTIVSLEYRSLHDATRQGKISLRNTKKQLLLHDSLFESRGRTFVIEQLSLDKEQKLMRGSGRIDYQNATDSRRIDLRGRADFSNVVRARNPNVDIDVYVTAGYKNSDLIENTFYVRSLADTRAGLEENKHDLVQLYDARGTLNTTYTLVDRNLKFRIDSNRYGKIYAGLDLHNLREIQGVVDISLFDIESIDPIGFKESVLFYQGILSGELQVSGSINVPIFSGAMRLTQGRARTPFSPDILGPANLSMTIEKNRIYLQEAYVVNGAGAGTISGEFYIHNNALQYINVNIASNDAVGLHIQYPFKTLYSSGYARGSIHLSGSPQSLGLWGSISIHDTEFSLVDGEGIAALSFLQLDIVSENGVRFTWPLEGSPIFRMLAQENQKLRLALDRRINKFSVDGNMELRSGEIFYFNRVFRLKEGKIAFVDIQDSLKLFISHVGIARERYQGRPMQLYLTAENETLEEYSPRITSDQDQSHAELLTLLGSTSGDVSQSGLYNFFGFTHSATSLAVGSAPLRTIERVVQDELNLDVLAIRSSAVKNAAYQLLLASEGYSLNQYNFFDTALSTVFHNSYVNIGKSFSENLYTEAFIHIQDADKVYARSGKLNVFVELHLEWQTPFFLFDWYFTPRNYRTFFVNDHKFGLSWKVSF